jgi:hypothetical protein
MAHESGPHRLLAIDQLPSRRRERESEFFRSPSLLEVVAVAPEESESVLSRL